MPVFIPEKWKPEEKSSLASPGRRCALRVAYLSKVTTALADASRKTPASAFTPVLHSHISFPHPSRVPTPRRTPTTTRLHSLPRRKVPQGESLLESVSFRKNCSGCKCTSVYLNCKFVCVFPDLSKVILCRCLFVFLFFCIFYQKGRQSVNANKAGTRPLPPPDADLPLSHCRANGRQ